MSVSLFLRHSKILSRSSCISSNYVFSYSLPRVKIRGLALQVTDNYRIVGMIPSPSINQLCRKSAVMYCSTSSKESANVKNSEEVSQNVSKKEKLKKAIKEYGATVVIFHVTLALASLGVTYLLVSSGLDVVAILEKLGVGQSILESKITQGASTFVVAYAVHKVFAPVRITITLSATPFIVRYLRNIGVLKKPVS